MSKSLEQLPGNGSFSSDRRLQLNLKVSTDDALERGSSPSSLRLSLDSYDDDASYIEMDPMILLRSSASTEAIHQFQAAGDYFDLASPKRQALALPKADQAALYNGGLLLPLRLLLHQPQSAQSQRSLADTLRLPPLSAGSGSCKLPPVSGSEGSRRRFPLLRRWTKRILEECLVLLLKRLYRRLIKAEKSAAEGGKAIGKTAFFTTSSQSSLTTGRRKGKSAAFSHHHNVLFDSHLESSIFEAVLHCKESIAAKGVDREELREQTKVDEPVGQRKKPAK